MGRGEEIRLALPKKAKKAERIFAYPRSAFFILGLLDSPVLACRSRYYNRMVRLMMTNKIKRTRIAPALVYRPPYPPLTSSAPLMLLPLSYTLSGVMCVRTPYCMNPEGAVIGPWYRPGQSMNLFIDSANPAHLGKSAQTILPNALRRYKRKQFADRFRREQWFRRHIDESGAAEALRPERS